MKIIIVGESGSGKTLFSKKCQEIGLEKIITNTTRPMREGEINGVDYHFRTIEQFKKMVENSEIAEYTVYDGNYYGSSFGDYKKNMSIVLETEGFLEVKKYFKQVKKENIIGIYLEVDDDKRIVRSKQRGDKKEATESRVNEDKDRFNNFVKYKCDYVLANYTIEEIEDFINKHKNIWVE